MLFSKLKISTKFIISSAILLIPIGILLFLYCSNANRTIQKSKEERNAIITLNSAVTVMRDLPLYLNAYLGLVEQEDLEKLDEQISAFELINEPDEQASEPDEQTSEPDELINEPDDQSSELDDQTGNVFQDLPVLGDWEPLDDQISELDDQISELDDQISELDELTGNISRDLMVLVDLEQLDDQISGALNFIDAELRRYNSDGRELPNILDDWKELKKTDKNDKELVQKYENFAISLRDMIVWIGERSGLILVSDTNSFYFAASAFFFIPDAIMRTIEIGNVVHKNLYRWENLRERNNIEEMKDINTEWFMEWVEKWRDSWMAREVLDEKQEVLDEERKEELWEEWVEQWKRNYWYNWWEQLDEEWREELWEEWVEKWREEMKEEWGEEWMKEWMTEIVTGLVTEEYGEEWVEESWDGYRAYWFFEGDQRDFPFRMFDEKDSWQIAEKLNLVEADEGRINTSLKSAMDDGNKKADNFEELTNRLGWYWETLLGSAMGEENEKADNFEKLTNKRSQYEKTLKFMNHQYYSNSGYYYIPGNTTGGDFLVTLSFLNTNLCDLWEAVFTNINEQVQRNLYDAVGQLIMSLGIVLISLVIAFAFLIFINMDINRSVKSLNTLFKGLNENDLTMSLKVNSKDEFGDLMTAFNGFLDILRSTVGSFKQSSQLVANSVFDLAASTKEITTTANEQSAGVSEIVSTMEGNKNLSEQIAFKTTEVANLANETQDLSSKGAELREANQTMMEEIRNQNQKIISEIRNVSDMIIRISEAIRIIDGIADQTKLIAFNASLEASSSGEAGARFSVVASEIRRFADNVVESTKEIKQKIEEVQGASQSLITEANSGSRQIETGYERMSEQKIVFEQIVDVSQNVATRSQQISNLSKQQELASSQIFTALKEISAGVKQFVAATSSTSKIADSLNGMSEELKEKVEKYRTET